MDINGIIERCKSGRKKKKMDKSCDEEYLTNLNQEINDRFFKRNNELEKILMYKIYDCLKLTKKLNLICKNDIRKLILKYKDSITNFILDNTYAKKSAESNNVNNSLLNSLHKYLIEKNSYDRSKFVLNPSIFIASSKINKSRVLENFNRANTEQKTIKQLAKCENVSYGTMYKYVTKILGFKYKGIVSLTERREYPINTQFQLLYFLKKANIDINNSVVVYIDESSFSNHRRVTRRWIHKTCSAQATNRGRIKSVNLMLAVSDAKVYHYKIKIGNNNSFTFHEFIRKMYKKINKDENCFLSKSKKEIYVILDNAKIHKSRHFNEAISNIDINFIYLPSYHPQINSCEYVFRGMKAKFYRRSSTNM